MSYTCKTRGNSSKLLLNNRSLANRLNSKKVECRKLREENKRLNIKVLKLTSWSSQMLQWAEKRKIQDVRPALENLLSLVPVLNSALDASTKSIACLNELFTHENHNSSHLWNNTIHSFIDKNNSTSKDASVTKQMEGKNKTRDTKRKGVNVVRPMKFGHVLGIPRVSLNRLRLLPTPAVTALINRIEEHIVVEEEVEAEAEVEVGRASASPLDNMPTPSNLPSPSSPEAASVSVIEESVQVNTELALEAARGSSSPERINTTTESTSEPTNSATSVDTLQSISTLINNENYQEQDSITVTGAVARCFSRIHPNIREGSSCLPVVPNPQALAIGTSKPGPLSRKVAIQSKRTNNRPGPLSKKFASRPTLSSRKPTSPKLQSISSRQQLQLDAPCKVMVHNLKNLFPSKKLTASSLTLNTSMKRTPVVVLEDCSHIITNQSLLNEDNSESSLRKSPFSSNRNCKSSLCDSNIKRKKLKFDDDGDWLPGKVLKSPNNMSGLSSSDSEDEDCNRFLRQYVTIRRKPNAKENKKLSSKEETEKISYPKTPKQSNSNHLCVSTTNGPLDTCKDKASTRDGQSASNKEKSSLLCSSSDSTDDNLNSQKYQKKHAFSHMNIPEARKSYLNAFIQRVQAENPLEGTSKHYESKKQPVYSAKYTSKKLMKKSKAKRTVKKISYAQSPEENTFTTEIDETWRPRKKKKKTEKKKKEP